MSGIRFKRMQDFFRDGVTTAAYTTCSYIYSQGKTVAVIVSEGHREKAEAIANAINTHDDLIRGAQVASPPKAEERRPLPGQIIPISTPGCKDSLWNGLYYQDFSLAKRPTPAPHPSEAETLYEIAAMIFDEMPEGGVANLARATTIAAAIMEKLAARGGTAPSPAVDEIARTRAVLKDAGHEHEGRSLHVLVDIAVDTERSRRDKAEKRVAALLDSIGAAVAE